MQGQYNTTANYKLSNKHIVELTPLRECHQKLSIINFLNVELVWELLCWTALNRIGVPYKVDMECIFSLT